MRSGFLGKVSAYGLSQLVVAGTGAVGVLFTTHILTRPEFGLLDTAATFFYWCVIVFGCGGADPMTRYFSLSSSETEKEKIVSSWMIFHLISYIVLCAILLSGETLAGLFSGDQKYMGAIHIILALTIVVSFKNSMLQLLRYEQKTKEYVIAETTMACLSVLLGIAFLLQGFGLTGWVTASCISGIITTIILLWINRKWVFNTPEFKIVKRLFIYGLPLVPSYMFWYAMLMVDRLMLRSFDKAEVALFVLAFKLTLLIKMINAAFGMAWGPRAMEMYKKQKKEVPEKYSYALSGYLMLSLLGALVFCTVAPNFISLLFPSSYMASASILPILMIPIIAEGTTFITGMSIGIKEKTKWIILPPFLGLAINIILNNILIPKYGSGGAALASAISFIVLAFVYYTLGNKLIRLSVPKQIRYICLAIIMGLVFFVIAPEPAVNDTLIRLVIFIIICAASYKVVSKELKKIVLLLKEESINANTAAN